MSFHREPTDSVPDETIVSRTARLCATLFATNGQFMSRHRLSCNLHSERPMRRLCGTKGGAIMEEATERTIALQEDIYAMVEDLARRDDVPPDAVVGVAVERYWRQRRQQDVDALRTPEPDDAPMGAVDDAGMARIDVVEQAQSTWNDVLSDHLDNA